MFSLLSISAAMMHAFPFLLPSNITSSPQFLSRFSLSVLLKNFTHIILANPIISRSSGVYAVRARISPSTTCTRENSSNRNEYKKAKATFWSITARRKVDMFSA